MLAVIQNISVTNKKIMKSSASVFIMQGKRRDQAVIFCVATWHIRMM
jgi:hypothetical protein